MLNKNFEDTQIVCRSQAFTARGARIQNQDRHFCDDNLGLYFVVDGMGGTKGGCLASQIVRNSLQQQLRSFLQYRDTSSPLDKETLEHVAANAFETAARAMNSVAERRTDLSEMGATLAVGVVSGSKLYYTHFGDTRVYLHRRRVQLLTEDETVAHELAHAGIISEADEAQNDWRHAIVHSLSAGRPLEKPRWESVELFPGDRFVLTTNGVTEPLDEAKLSDLLDLDDSSTNLAKGLVDAAHEVDPRHNATCIVCSCTVESDR